MQFARDAFAFLFLRAQDLTHFDAAETLADKQRTAVHWELQQLRAALADLGSPLIVLKGAAYAAANLPASFQNVPEEDPAPGADGTCSDLLDNDSDGQIDGEDPDCTRIELGGGTLPATLALDYPLSFELDTGADPDAFYLTGFDPANVWVTADDPISSFTGRFGFTDLTVGGNALLNEHIQLSFKDPDLNGKITQDEWTNTAQVDLLQSKYLDSTGEDGSAWAWRRRTRRRGRATS